MMKDTIQDLLNYLYHAERAIKKSYFFASTQSLLRHIPTKWYVKKSRLVYKHAPKPLYITINSKLGGHATSRYNTNQSISICGPVGSTSVRDNSTRQSSRLFSVDLHPVVATRKI